MSLTELKPWMRGFRIHTAEQTPFEILFSVGIKTTPDPRNEVKWVMAGSGINGFTGNSSNAKIATPEKLLSIVKDINNQYYYEVIRKIIKY